MILIDKDLKFVLHPGRGKSAETQCERLVSFEELITLYDLPASQCVDEKDFPTSAADYNSAKNIHLWPLRTDDNIPYSHLTYNLWLKLCLQMQEPTPNEQFEKAVTLLKDIFNELKSMGDVISLDTLEDIDEFLNTL